MNGKHLLASVGNAGGSTCRAICQECHGHLHRWNAMQDPHTKEVLRYVGWDESLSFIKDYIGLHGPFDGFLGFSQVACHGCTRALHAGMQPRSWAECAAAGAQGTILASLLLSMKRSGQILQVRRGVPSSRITLRPRMCMQAACAVPARAQQPQAPRFALCIGGVVAAPFLRHHYAGGLLPFHSLHVIGEKDFVRKVQPAA